MSSLVACNKAKEEVIALSDTSSEETTEKNDNTDLVILDEVSLQEEQSTDGHEDGKKILVAKKFLLERRILTKVLDNLGYDFDIVEDMNELESKLASGHYDILFTDPDLVTESLQAHDVSVVTESKVKDEIEAAIKAHRG
ncbi:MAG: hypothetical protein L3J47_09470 [Sulfurovum sp.]|nr:hypothetical protein [Sulfurovum sp.]